MEEFDLAKELEEPTEEIIEAQDFEESEPESNADDFENFETEIEDIDPEDEPPKAKKFNAKKIAYYWIRSFNIIQKRVMKSLYKKTILQKGDQEAVERNIQQEDAGIVIGEPEKGTPEYFQRQRMEKFLKYCEAAPFTDDEVEMLVDPLAQVVEKYKALQLTPEGQLALAVFFVMLPRLDPLFPSLTKMFEKKVKAES